MEPFPLLPKDAIRKAPAEAPADAMEPFPLLPKDAMRETKPDSGHGIKNWEDVPMGADPVDVGVGVLKNAIPSTARLAVGLYDAVRHASDTAGAVKDLAGGVISKLDGLARKQDPETKAKDEATLNAFTQHYANKYGSIDKITHTLANDPAEFLADLSAVTTPAGLLAKGTGTVAKVAAGVRNAGNAIDPFQVAGRAVRGAYRSVRPAKAAAPAVDIAAATANRVTPAHIAALPAEDRAIYEAAIARGEPPVAAMMKASGVEEVSRSVVRGVAPSASSRQAVEDSVGRGHERLGARGEAISGEAAPHDYAAAEAIQKANIAAYNKVAADYHTLDMAPGHFSPAAADHFGKDIAASLANPQGGGMRNFNRLPDAPVQTGDNIAASDLAYMRDHYKHTLPGLHKTIEALDLLAKHVVPDTVAANGRVMRGSLPHGGDLTFQNFNTTRGQLNALWKGAVRSDRVHLRGVIDGFDKAVERAIPTHYVGPANPADLLTVMRSATAGYRDYINTFVAPQSGGEALSRVVDHLSSHQKKGYEFSATPPAQRCHIVTEALPDVLQDAQIKLGKALLNPLAGPAAYQNVVRALGGAATPEAKAVKDFIRQSILQTDNGKLVLNHKKMGDYLNHSNSVAHHVFTPSEIAQLKIANEARGALNVTPSKAATAQNLASGVANRLLRGATAGAVGSIHSIPGSIALMGLEHAGEKAWSYIRRKREFAPLAAKGPGVLARTIPRVSRLPLAAYEAGQMRPGATKPSERKSFPKDTTQRYSAVASSLTKDLGITSAQAMGIISNLHAESGIRAVNEVRPTIPGSRGGFGWAQWTGPRRVEFEKFAASKGLSPASDAANYGFLVHDLKTTYPRVLAQVRQAPTAEAAAHVFFQGYESRGDPKLESRRAVHVALARRFASTGGRIERNSGGRVEALIRAAEGAGRRENQATRPLLALPDAAVVRALSVANRSL